MSVVTSAGVMLFFESKAMARQVQEMTAAAIPEYFDAGKGYGEHVSTVVIDLNGEASTWRGNLTPAQIDALGAQSEQSVMASKALARIKIDVCTFPPVALIGLEAADPPKYPNADFSLFCGKVDGDSVVEGALRELREESTIRLHRDFLEEEFQQELRLKLGFPNFPLHHQLGWGKNQRQKQHLFFVIVPSNARRGRRQTGIDGRPEIHISPCGTEGKIEQLKLENLALF